MKKLMKLVYILLTIIVGSAEKNLGMIKLNTISKTTMPKGKHSVHIEDTYQKLKDPGFSHNQFHKSQVKKPNTKKLLKIKNSNINNIPHPLNPSPQRVAYATKSKPSTGVSARQIGFGNPPKVNLVDVDVLRRLHALNMLHENEVNHNHLGKSTVENADKVRKMKLGSEYPNIAFEILDGQSPLEIITGKKQSKTSSKEKTMQNSANQGVDNNDSSFDQHQNVVQPGQVRTNFVLPTKIIQSSSNANDHELAIHNEYRGKLRDLDGVPSKPNKHLRTSQGVEVRPSKSATGRSLLVIGKPLAKQVHPAKAFKRLDTNHTKITPSTDTANKKLDTGRAHYISRPTKQIKSLAKTGKQMNIDSSVVTQTKSTRKTEKPKSILIPNIVQLILTATNNFINSSSVTSKTEARDLQTETSTRSPVRLSGVRISATSKPYLFKKETELSNTTATTLLPTTKMPLTKDSALDVTGIPTTISNTIPGITDKFITQAATTLIPTGADIPTSTTRFPSTVSMPTTQTQPTDVQALPTPETALLTANYSRGSSSSKNRTLFDMVLTALPTGKNKPLAAPTSKTLPTIAATQGTTTIPSTKIPTTQPTTKRTTTSAIVTSTQDWCHFLCITMKFCPPACSGHFTSWS